MDVLFSIVTGLGLRLLLDTLDEPLGLFSPVLLGLWEGAAVHRFSASAASSDHYLAYALRVALDFYFTANLQRTLVVLLWSTLGFLLSESLNLSLTRKSRRRRSSRSSVPAHVRHYQPAVTPEPISRVRDTPQTRAHQVLVQSSTPTFRPSRPASPPSFFLEGESDATVSPRQPRYLPSALGPESETDSLLGSPPPKPVLLPTPPSTLASIGGGLDIPGSFIDIRRLSTIEEQSSGDEDSRREARFLDGPSGHMGLSHPSYAPSIATTVPPVPIPNSTIYHPQASTSRASPIAQLVEAEDTYAASTSAAPLPVPNAGVTYPHATLTRPGTPSDGGDPLQTPQAASRRWELTDNDDGLTTPGPPAQLSPLALEHNLFPSFGQMVVKEIPTSQVVPEVPATATITVTKTTDTKTTTTVVPNVQPPVEYHSQPVGSDAVPEDNPNPVTTVFKPESDSGLKSSYPTPVASPSSKNSPGNNESLKPRVQQQEGGDTSSNGQRHQQQRQQQEGEHISNGQQQQQRQEGGHSSGQQQQQQQQPDLYEAGQETETEDSAPSIISYGPGRILYEKAEDVRREARAAENEKLRLTKLLGDATKNARVKDILFLKEEIREVEATAVKLHARAARRFYKARNASHNPRNVDVHGLRRDEAILMTEKALREALTLKCTTVRVIVGRGLHSPHGIPVLKDAILKAMYAYKISCVVDPKNPGVLILTLPAS